MMTEAQDATGSQIARLAADWSAIAGEEVAVEKIGPCFYGYCSELGAYRIAAKYRSWNAGYSKNIGTWYFWLEV